MAQQPAFSVENNFTKGLITESTGLNFPENAATATDNCVYTLVGDVMRRQGIDLETNGVNGGSTRNNFGISDYKWDNAGGDGNTQLIVRQLGNGLFFYLSSSATAAAPISANKLLTSIDLLSYVAFGNVLDVLSECQYASGNGYLFVYHISCDPIYVSYNSGSQTVTANRITVKIRDFSGVIDGLTTDTRPSTLSLDHQYNLVNQGWVKGTPWDVTSASAVSIGTGSKGFFIGTGVSGIVAGQQVRVLYVTGGSISIPSNTPVMSGTVTAYAAGVLTLNITDATAAYIGDVPTGWRIQPTSSGYIDTWLTAVGNYPSNSDVWWYFKDSTGVYNPATTNQNVTIATGNAPKGHFLLEAFNQQRATVSGIGGITPVLTVQRPTTGCWFQGRVWYTGVNSSQQATGDANQYTWSESIYFSQIITDVSQFGNCFQQNDPTSENLFDLLPTDGGVIVPQGGCGKIYKLFPIQNGLLVFAANGVWYITGSQGIGFSADDYTVTKISSVRSISSTSFVDVHGLPYFWNEEGIYAVEPGQNGGLMVNPITVGTILSFYSDIPTFCKRFVRGAYDPINYIIQWVYRSDSPPDFNGRYAFDRILNFNTFNKAFFPYSIDNTIANINGIIYISYPNGSSAPEASFKYPMTVNNANICYADEHDTSYFDWKTSVIGGFNYVSYFITGYKLRGQVIRKFQPQYVQVWSRVNESNSGYKIQGLWDFANNRSSGNWSTIQNITNGLAIGFDVIHRRHRIRGNGYALQFKISSQDGVPFDIAGWAVYDTVNAGV